MLVGGNYDDILALPISISQNVAAALGRRVENSVEKKTSNYNQTEQYLHDLMSNYISEWGT